MNNKYVNDVLANILKQKQHMLFH